MFMMGCGALVTHGGCYAWYVYERVWYYVHDTSMFGTISISATIQF